MSTPPLQNITTMAPPFAALPYATGAIVAGLLALAYLAYQWALPRPIPGIPYNPAAARRIMGDAAEIMAVKKAGGAARVWFSQQTTRHQSPVAQVFLGPFSKPSLIISDYREGNDILLRRLKEFDRSTRSLEAMSGVLAGHHISMATSDPQFKINRQLVRDLMTPKFLNEVSGPEIYKNANKFIDMWRLKARLAGGRPFLARDDIHATAFDIIIESAIGENEDGSLIDKYFDRLRQLDGDSSGGSGPGPKRGAGGPDAEFVFPTYRDTEEMQVHVTLFEAISESALSPSPRLFHWFNNKKASIREALATKEAILGRHMRRAIEHLEAGGAVKCSLDHMIKRETEAAKKAGRQPDLSSVSMKDELWGYVGAGHDTTSTSVQWAVKHLGRLPDVQQRLRQALRRAHPAAAKGGRAPTIGEITSTTVPYLEGFMEEVLRLTSPVKSVLREAMVDTQVLGHRIPKGTNIFINVEGPSLTSAAIPVDEATRSESSRSSNRKRGNWDDMDPQAFDPERWITHEGESEGGADADADAAEGFDQQAGPLLSFGGGLRGCFGRRLAYLEFRIVMTLLSWSFEFQPIPEDMDSFLPIDFIISKPQQCFVRLTEAN